VGGPAATSELMPEVVRLLGRLVKATEKIGMCLGEVRDAVENLDRTASEGSDTDSEVGMEELEMEMGEVAGELEELEGEENGEVIGGPSGFPL
jgi:hypothetical protein